MAKSTVALQDLQAALTSLSTKVDGYETPISMIVDINKKLDAIMKVLQTAKPAPEEKKAATRSKAKKAKVDEPSTDANDEPAADTVELTTESKELVQTNGAAQTNGQTNGQTNNTLQTESEEKKAKPAPKAKASKPKGMKTTKAPVTEDEEKKNKPINKMEFFHLKYKEDPTFFDTYLKPSTKSQIDKENAEEWANITDADKLYTLKRKAYYNWMSANHDSILQNMKKNYIEEIAKSSIKLTNTEPDDD